MTVMGVCPPITGCSPCDCGDSGCYGGGGMGTTYITPQDYWRTNCGRNMTRSVLESGLYKLAS